MKMPGISVALATFNEEENIGSCLEAVKDFADEIIIVDGESTDRTVEIAKKYGAKVIVTTNKPIFHINKQMAIDAAERDWILQLDADERVTPELREEILTVIKSKTEFNGFWIPRRNFFLGRWLKKGGQYPDYVIRFFKKGKAYLPCKSVHEQMKVKGKVGYLKGHLLHYTAPTFPRYLTNANRYTSLTAAELKQESLPINLWNGFKYLVGLPVKTFFLIYFRHKGFLDGFPGFIFAFFSALHWPVAYMKYWELKNESCH